MNNYLLNQIRRADCTLAKKILTFVLGALCPRTAERSWRRHSAKMQNELNREHSNRYGWWIDCEHELHLA